MWKKIIIIITSLWLSFSVYANTDSPATEGKTVSIEELKAQAAQNNSDALLQLAILHLHGKGVEQDNVKAIFLLKKAQSLGNEKADEILKELQHTLNHPDQKLIDVLEARVKSGDINAMTTLAMMYIDGRGVEKNVQMGVLMLEKAIAANSNNARTALGIMYLTGKKGIPQDLTKAQDLLSHAAKHGNFAAQTLLKCLQQSIGCPKD